MRTIIAGVILSAVLTVGLYAQDSSTAKPSLPVADGPSIPLTAAVVVRYDDDGTIEVQETGRNAQRVRLAVNPIFIDRNGKLILPGPGAIKPGTKVYVHYMPDGDQMIIDRVILR